METRTVRLHHTGLIAPYLDIILATGPWLPDTVPGYPIVVAESDLDRIDPADILAPGCYANFDTTYGPLVGWHRLDTVDPADLETHQEFGSVPTVLV